MNESFQLHGFWRSLGTYRVRIALAIKELNFTEDSVNLLEGEQFKATISKLNPQCTLPIMLHDQSTLTQSLAIIEYIDECFPTPPLLPENPLDRAWVRSFALITIADAHPLTVPRARKQLAQQFNANDDDIELWAQHWSRLALDAMESRLNDRTESSDFCYSNEPGLADIGLASQVAGAGFFGVALDNYPSILKTMKNINKRDEFVLTSPQAIKEQT